MHRSSLIALLVAAFTTFAGSPAWAHDPGMSSAHVVATARSLSVTLSLAQRDLATVLTGRNESPHTLSGTMSVQPAAVAQLAEEVVQLHRGAEVIPPASFDVAVPSRANADATITVNWTRSTAAASRLEFPILQQLPFGHRMVLTADSSTAPVSLLDRKHFSYDLSAMKSSATDAAPTVPAPAPANWFSFLRLGVEHILAGFDHLCFLLALLLVAVRSREIFAVITTFTVAHSLTLVAAATGVVSIPSGVVEPLIAASIVYIGFENLLLRRAPRHRALVVFAFGLVHGLGFASALGERLPDVRGPAIIAPLLSFNVGVELGQLAVAAVLVPLIGLLRNRPVLAGRLQPAFSLAIAIAGLVWFSQRI